MAKVVNPLLSTEARGKLGGLIYNTWHGINYVKSFTAPNQPGSAKQLQLRNMFQTTSQLWADLSDAERLTWSAYADSHLLPDWTGTPRRITSQNWFIKCNINALRAGGIETLTAPTTDQPDPVESLTITAASGAVQASWTSPTSGDFTLDFWAAGPHSNGRQPSIHRATCVKLLPVATTQPATIIDSAAAGRHTIWARVIDKTTGLCSTWVKTTVDVT